MKPKGLYEEFGHVPTSIYIPIDTLMILYYMYYLYLHFRKCKKSGKMLKGPEPKLQDLALS
jgi:hypothetical protein